MTGVPPVLSVVIPTRNRQEYARAAVAQVLSVTSDRVEIVVQDNSDDGTLLSMLEPLGIGSRLQYSHVNGPQSFSANFGAGAARARGEMLCFIGDDDGVLPNLEPLANWAATRNVQAVSPTTPAVFYWPGSMTGARAHLDATVTSGQIPTPFVRRTATAPAIKTLLSRGGVDYLSLPLVKAYHGLIRRDLVEVVRARTGHYFGGLSPDIYGAVALSLAAGHVYSINWPVTLPGICSSSGSADSASGRHTGELDHAPHFRGHDNYEWPEEVPPVYCVETIWAESALRGAREMGNADRFGEDELRRIVWRRHPQLRSEVDRRPHLKGMWVSSKVGTSRIVRSVSSRARGLVAPPTVVKGVRDIADAAHVVDGLLLSAHGSHAAAIQVLDASTAQVPNR